MTEIVINHLTRMREPRICVAGLTTDGGEHIRPVPSMGQTLVRSMLRSEGGIFGLGARVDLGQTTPMGSPPEVEDQSFSPARAREAGVVEPDLYWEMVDEACHDDLESIFGPSLTRIGGGFSTPEGMGVASLGCLRVAPIGRIKVFVGKRDTVRMRIPEFDEAFFPAVTDLRLYEADHATPRTDVIQSVQERLDAGVSLRLMVGLAHAWALDGGERRHSLQINGICLQDSPLGDVP